MQKIISLFKRNYETDHLARNEIVEGAEWVTAGEGIATRKWDGTCCLIRDGRLYKRYEVGKGKRPPQNFSPANPVDPVTGKQQGWLPVSDTDPGDRYHREAVAGGMPPDGTYELVGPKIQGNPDGVDSHRLVPHGKAILDDAPRDFDRLKAWLAGANIEGIVWHHPDGRMVKIKAKDFSRQSPARKG